MRAFSQSDAVFSFAERLRANRLFGIALAIGTFLVALALRFAVDHSLPTGFPYLTFFPAVLITAFFGGTLAGVLCALLSMLAAWYWFIPPFDTFAMEPTTLVAVMFFVFIIAVDLTIIHIMTTAIAQLRHQERFAHDLVDRQKTLFQELQHRTANNLTFVGALLNMYRRRASDQPEAAAAFKDAGLRLDTMSRVHRRLYDPASLDQPLADYLHGLVGDVLEASGQPKVAVNVTAIPARIDIQRLLTVSLVVIELVTNSVKHALNDRSGRLFADFAKTPDGQSYVLTVRDDGPGFPADFSPETTTRLGVRILNNFCRNLDGTIAYANEDGAVTRVTFPVAPRAD